MSPSSKKTKPQISVIMPTFNEKGNIGELIRRTGNTLRPLGKRFEIIVIDDNSPDGTASVVKKLQTTHPHLRLVVRKEKGLPGAIGTGLKAAKGDIVSWFDCDLSMPPEKLPEMIAGLNNSDIIIGSTFLSGSSDKRGVVHSRIFSRLINLFTQIILGGGITDYTSGFIVAKKTALADTRFEGTHGTYFIGMLYQALKKGYKIAEVPYTLTPRGYGESKITGFWPYFKTGLVYLKTVVKTRFSSAL